jgi:hypothetical protein
VKSIAYHNSYVGFATCLSLFLLCSSAFTYASAAASSTNTNTTSFLNNETSKNFKVVTSEVFRFMAANNTALSTREETMKDIISGIVSSIPNFPKIRPTDPVTVIGKIMNKITRTEQNVEGLEFINVVTGLEIRNAINFNFTNQPTSNIVIDRESACQDQTSNVISDKMSSVICAINITISK